MTARKYGTHTAEELREEPTKKSAEDYLQEHGILMRGGELAELAPNGALRQWRFLGEVMEAFADERHSAARSALLPLLDRVEELEREIGMQGRVTVWATRCFGVEQMTDPRVRALRLAEEAIEFAQSVGVPRHQLDALALYVYTRPAGDPKQELGGVAVTALAAASSVGVQLSDVLRAEVERVEAKSDAHFAARNQVKVDAGFGPLPAPPALEEK